MRKLWHVGSFRNGYLASLAALQKLSRGGSLMPPLCCSSVGVWPAQKNAWVRPGTAAIGPHSQGAIRCTDHFAKRIMSRAQTFLARNSVGSRLVGGEISVGIA